MAFMEPEVTYGDWYEVTTDGIDFIPVDVVSNADGLTIGQHATMDDPAWDVIAELLQPYVNGTPQEVRRISGFGARLSAPGYLDCTDWAVFETEQEARDYLRDELGIDDKLGAKDRNDLITILQECDPEIDTDRGTDALRELIALMIENGEIDSDDL